jgi:hypothetical protein
MINILGVKLAAKPMFFELDIDQPPPVLMLAINPEDFNKSFTKKVTQARHRPTTRNTASYIYNFDYDELDVMNCSGTSAMFYSSNGLEMLSRKETLGYRNLRSLIEIYRNNGRNYYTRPTNTSPLLTGGGGLIKSVGKVIIAYDDVLYGGSFDSMSITETDEKPFNMQFNFQFTIIDTVDARNV